MKSIIVVALVAMGMGYSYGIRPAFDLYGGWESITLYSGGNHSESGFATMMIGTTVPYNRCIGLNAGIGGILLGSDQTSYMVAGNIGLMEMIPGKYLSPYFKENIQLEATTSGNDAVSNLGLGVGIGLEFISNSYLSPFIEGGFSWSLTRMNYLSSNVLEISVGGGVRLSWIK